MARNKVTVIGAGNVGATAAPILDGGGIPVRQQTWPANRSPLGEAPGTAGGLSIPGPKRPLHSGRELQHLEIPRG